MAYKDVYAVRFAHTRENRLRDNLDACLFKIVKDIGMQAVESPFGIHAGLVEIMEFVHFGAETGGVRDVRTGDEFSDFDGFGEGLSTAYGNILCSLKGAEESRMPVRECLFVGEESTEPLGLFYTFGGEFRFFAGAALAACVANDKSNFFVGGEAFVDGFQFDEVRVVGKGHELAVLSDFFGGGFAEARVVARDFCRRGGTAVGEVG